MCTRMLAAVDAGGMPVFGPSSDGGNVCSVDDVKRRYALLVAAQKGAAGIMVDTSSITFMARVKCGCGAKGQQQLQHLGVHTLGDLVALNDDEIKTKIVNGGGLITTLTLEKVEKWIAALKAKRIASSAH